MIFKPSVPEIEKHIDHYWILNNKNIQSLSNTSMYAYPGITPDMIIVLEGYYTITYLGKIYRSNKSRLFSFIHDVALIDLSGLKACIVIKFKSRGLSSLLPFVTANADSLMRDSVAIVDDVFNIDMSHFVAYLQGLPSSHIAIALDQWFLEKYNYHSESFTVEMAQEVSESFDIRTIMTVTGYSYSTLERYFKKDTGLTPKRFQSLQRYKLALRELYVTRNSDWQHYVAAYGYFDQSHFIKEIKRYTKQTPTQLLKTSAFIEVRPLYYDEILQ